jgi:5-methylcytosine-specific restriction protein B
MPDKEKIKDASKNDWWPMDYSPNLSVEEWVSLIKDREVFNISSLEIMKRMLDCGGQATCKQLSLKYGETANFYNSGSVALARRVARKTGCPPREAETSKWWPMLYLGKKAGRETEGTFLQKLRDELMEALKQVDLSGVRLYASAELDEENRGFWWLTANPKYWRFSDIFVGDTESYSLCNDDGNKRRIYQNFLDAKAGDLVIGYEAAPVKKITAICRIAAEQDGEEIYFEKMEGLVSPVEYQTLRDCQELEQMEFFRNPRGSLFKLTRDEYHFILDVIREENPVLPERVVDRYTKDNFLEEVYMTGADYDKLSAMLLHKKNIILQGAPGVGKTFAAKRLAWSIMGEKDENRIEFVQFHQNYSYEDFVMGYKPVEDRFERKDGVFYRFCQKAENQPGKAFFFIIDEINRGNMSKIFGELLMLIEKEYRGTKIALTYSDFPFSVPDNLYIIGMMNTADRSLAMIDYALRRRFSFFEMEPGFHSEGFMRYQSGLNNEKLNELIERVKELNQKIIADKSLGKGFCIGHSYFCNQTVCTDEWLDIIVNYEILPMLSEYWFDEPATLQRWESNLRGALQ